MIRAAVEDEPAVVLLQELPVATLTRLHAWSGYQAFGAVASRPRLPPRIATKLTDLHAGLLRSALEGQANAILLAPDLRGSDAGSVFLNARRFRNREAARLALPLGARVAWARERRVCHAVRATLGDGRTLVVANLHATNYRPDKRIADVELLRAAAFADAVAQRDEPIVLGGDFNVTVVSSPTLRALSTPEWGFSAARPGVDHVLVRGLTVTSPETRWPDERRRVDARLMSDHAPVDVVVE